jgi:hypothetical protein
VLKRWGLESELGSEGRGDAGKRGIEG